LYPFNFCYLKKLNVKKSAMHVENGNKP
jgi:hypothetical protein